MKCRLKFTITFLLLFSALHSPYGWSDPFDSWNETKDTHFIVKYRDPNDASLARDILRKAEEYYDKIAYQIGYSRYQNFWTWDDRVKIILFPDQKTFSETTGQPEWSLGFASRHSNLFESRAIVTFKQEDNFLQGVLPHEISHLIFRDMIGFDRQIPVWLDEGLAQLQERHPEIIERVMPLLVKENQHIPFGEFFSINIQNETDSQRVMVYYAQSYTVVKFLLKIQGHDAFFEFCRELRDGKNFEEAMKSAYSPSLNSIEELEKKWVASMTSP